MAQASLGPFLYSDAGFQARAAAIGNGTQCHSRMDCKELYALITSSKPHAVPHGTSSGFYAAQLLHYGLPVPSLPWPADVAEAIKTFKAVFKVKDGKYKLAVPDAISSIKQKLKDEYEEMTVQAKEERIARIQAQLAQIEETRKVEEQLRNGLRGLQTTSKGKKRRVSDADTDALAASTLRLSVEPNDAVARQARPIISAHCVVHVEESDSKRTGHDSREGS